MVAITESTVVKVVGENGAVSYVDYPFRSNAHNFDYLLTKRLIALHEMDDEEDGTPAEMARRVIRRPSPKDIPNLR